MNDIRIETKDKKAYVYTPYNKNFVQKIKKTWRVVIRTWR